MRWVASSAVIYGTFVATRLVGIGLDSLPLYLIGGAIAAYNSLFYIALKWTEAAPSAGRRSRVRAMANGQIVIDLLFLTLLIHFLGGVASHFSSFFVFHVVIASILLSRRDTFLQASVASALFGGLVLGEFTGVIPHLTVFDFARTDPARSSLFVATALLVFGATLYLVAYMATSIVGRLREGDRDILTLNSELENRARELEDAYQRLAGVEQMKSQYMRKVSHEIRAPMAAIHASLRVVLDGLTGDVPAKQREMIARAERRTAGLLSLVGDLLTLSRTRDAKLLTERKWVDLLQVVEKVVALQSPRAAAKEIGLTHQAAGAVPPLLVDPEALEELLTNLLSNAINYTPTGGRVDLKVDCIDDSVRLQVSDTGIGISPLDLPKVFNEFYRAENARRYSEEGTGLGLAIVRSIVDTYGGEINVESEVGVGTTFTVRLPSQTEAVQQEEGGNGEPPEHATAVGPILDQAQQGGSYMMRGEQTRQGPQAVATVSGRDSLPALLAALQQYGELYGPIRKNKAAVFAPITSASDLALDYGTTILPPKKLLLQPMETLFSVRRQNGFHTQQEIPTGNQVLFGVHSCDLNAIKLLDKVYLQSHVDPYYQARRDNTLIVAMTCTTPPYANCFCSSVNTGPSPKDGYDLLLTEMGDSLILEAGSPRGATIIEEIGWTAASEELLASKEQAVRDAAARMPKAINSAGLPELMNASYSHPSWAKLKERCLGCGNCALSCPSCYCYNVVDQVALDTVSVNRTRTWDVCLLQDFAEVHGGNFRKDRDARLKQFMYHKLSYWVDQYGTLGCVGCGRCINACPAGIDITQVVSEIRSEAR